ncbi:glutamate--cysteine ligase [Streptomyces sp. NPDC003077]|uniref:carboxylate-amine ligase n=1 Tax=Streptomyces sp. NPDC003077 TaxID=3154443 RepID=UPI0033AF5E34
MSIGGEVATDGGSADRGSMGEVSMGGASSGGRSTDEVSSDAVSSDAASSGEVSTLGVEEEFFLVDPDSGAVVAAGSRVVRRAREALGDLVSGEFTEYQVEGKTPPCATPGEVEGHLLRVRTHLAAAAREEGLRIVASGTPVIEPGGPVPVRDDPRYRLGTLAYRAMADDFALSALHVHVHLPDREHAILVGNHLRPWLPLLVAIAANSPFWRHRDTGYASWRTVVAAQWPQAGPPPYLAGADAYDALAAALHETGATVDAGTLFWDVRPSAHLPTIEIRLMDATTDPRDAAAFSALVRAMVHTAHARVRRGDPGPALCDGLLRAAYWRAARDGLSGHIPHPETGRLIPTGRLARELAHRLRPALERHGDWATVTAATDRLTTHGGGAERQRTAYARRGSLHDVVRHLCRHTIRAHADNGRTTVSP